MSSLTRKTSEISVLVDGRERRFRLSAQSITQQLEQLEVQERARQAAIEAAEDTFAADTPLTAASRVYLGSLAKLVMKLLSDPIDGGEQLTEEEFWMLESDDPERVIGAQEELTNMETIVGKALALQQLAGRQVLEKLSKAGEQSGAQ